jgi:hypothetical protein
MTPLPGQTCGTARILRRAIIRAAHAQTVRLWPGNTYPDVAEITAAMLGTSADEVRHVALREPMQGDGLG